MRFCVRRSVEDGQRRQHVENCVRSHTTVSIGDVAINPTDRTSWWVGTGEANNRQALLGDGIYKSTAAEDLEENGTARVAPHREHHHDPMDTDIVYVAPSPAMGRQ